jgi:hypothetical protein
MENEPRSVLDMMSDMLDIIKDQEFNYYYKDRFGDGSYQCGWCGCTKEDGHKVDCKVKNLISEVEAFIAVERDLESGKK